MFKNIAIDGPAGAGKSTIAKELARILNYVYIDTGALYRTVGLYIIENIGAMWCVGDVNKILENINIEIKFINEEQHVFLNNSDVSKNIREDDVSKIASEISALKEVRDFLLELQKKMASTNNVVMDGRDIGTVVLPNANLKIFLTATPQRRAERRIKQLGYIGKNIDYDTVLKNIIERDNRDATRDIAPLKKADDAIELNNTNDSLEETLQKILLLTKDI